MKASNLPKLVEARLRKLSTDVVPAGQNKNGPRQRFFKHHMCCS